MCVQTRRCHRGMKLGVRNRRQSIDVLSIYRSPCCHMLLSSSPLCLDTLANGKHSGRNLMSIVLLYKYSGSQQGPSPRFPREQ